MRHAIIWAAVSTEKQATREKYSVDDQVSMGREWCKRNNCHVLDVLVVRGFSRDYLTLADVVAASDDTEVDAFRKLHEHIQKADFDVFVCFDADRIGRTMSLVLELVARITRDVEAELVTLFDNTTLSEGNASLVGILKAYQAQNHIDKIREYIEKGMTKRLTEGKSVAPTPARFQRRIRDAKSGKEIDIVVDEALRPMFNDMAAVLLRGVPWDKFSQVMADEYGHRRADGRPHSQSYFYDWMTNPAFWGHGARNHQERKGKRTHHVGAWAWDSAESPPDYVTVERDIYTPVYAGELAERVKAELWRRHMILRGRMRPDYTHRFSGLLLCEECEYTLTVYPSNRGRRWRYYYCETHRKPHTRSVPCAQNGGVREDYIEEWFTQQIQYRLEGKESTLFNPPTRPNAERQLDDIQSRLEQLERRIGTLIREQSTAPDIAQDYYRTEIDNLSREAETVKQRRAEIEHIAASQRRQSTIQNLALDYIRDIKLENFWQRESYEIHQILAQLLGGDQLVIRDRQIIGLFPARNPRLAKQAKRTR